MIKISSEELQNNYESALEQIRQSVEKVFITTNSQIELVAMSVESFEKWQQNLLVQQLIMDSYINRLMGSKTYTSSEVLTLVDNIIEH